MSGQAPLKVALIGCGGVSKSHVAALKACRHARLVVTVDLDETRARERAEEAGPEVRWSTRPDDVLADPQIDVVGLLLPHHLHARATVAALTQGKHVLVEKPMALSLRDCAEMIRVAEAQERRLAVGQVLRFRHAHRFGREAVASGKIGEPVLTIRRRYAKRGSVTGQLAWSRDKETSGGLLYGRFCLLDPGAPTLGRRCAVRMAHDGRAGMRKRIDPKWPTGATRGGRPVESVVPGLGVMLKEQQRVQPRCARSRLVRAVADADVRETDVLRVAQDKRGALSGAPLFGCH